MLISSLGCLFSSLISGVFLFFTADSLLFTKSDKSLANFASFFLACGDWSTAGGSLLGSNCEQRLRKEKLCRRQCYCCSQAHSIQ